MASNPHDDDLPPGIRGEVREIVARLTALLPFVSEERRRAFRAALRRIGGQAHGVGVGSRFDAVVGEKEPDG